MTNLLPVLQTAIGPAILVSGTGLLLLTMTNRLGRAIDRARVMGPQLATAPAAKRAVMEAQIGIIWRRARQIRTAIAFATGSALLAAVLVIALFVTAIMGVAATAVIATLFIACMASLVVSLTIFLYDVNRSLLALRLELTSHGMDRSHFDAGPARRSFYFSAGRQVRVPLAVSASSRSRVRRAGQLATAPAPSFSASWRR